MGHGLRLDLGRAGTITAVLGPTNTGKTHLAIRRMLAHGTGMIGLPLRLLAREVYDRVVREKGVDQVALITGEEKLVPPGARYWVCTVESMPVDRPVGFLAVDEVQLAADRHRGHVFTDRLLHARGVGETWFMGSDTIAPVLQQLVPTAQIKRQPRLSRLSYGGTRRLQALAPRTAIVAFSMREVYQIAERVQRRHGGTAVVLGALSPRARNAQIELYQSGAVQYLVATDAIGMGLNMDVHHVALAGLHKFDGHEVRPLHDHELAQIAGRAGRYRTDGTFGTTDGSDPLSAETVEAIEQHRFAPVSQVYWRNSALCFDGPTELVASLEAPPKRGVLRAAHNADDVRALNRLLEQPEVRERLGSPDRLQLLWRVCGVPDFGNVMPEQHASLLAQLFVALLDGGGTVGGSWFEAQLRRLDRADGDIEVLMGRLAGVRVWTSVVHHPGWVEDASSWQTRAREVEERLSDALHQRLTDRFVDRRATAVARRIHLTPEGLVPALRPGGRVELAGQEVGTLRGLRFQLAEGVVEAPVLLKAVRACTRALIEERVQTLVQAPPGDFWIDPDGSVRWDGSRVARLLASEDWRRPHLRVLRDDWLDGGQRDRVHARLMRWREEWLASLSVGLGAPAGASPTVRAVLHAVTVGLGAVPRGEVAHLLHQDPERAPQALERCGLWVGRDWVLHPRVVERVRERWLLWRVAADGPIPELPDDHGRTPFQADWPPHMARALGFAPVAGWWVRVDTWEALVRGGAEAASVYDLSPVCWEAVRPALAGR
jgi:ATP-dependent RNA helicase SUPV3L1/SUV3